MAIHTFDVLRSESGKVFEQKERIKAFHAWGYQFAIHTLARAIGCSFSIVLNGRNYNPGDGNNDISENTVVWVRKNHFDGAWKLKPEREGKEGGEEDEEEEGDERDDDCQRATADPLELQRIENAQDLALRQQGFDLEFFLWFAANAFTEEGDVEDNEDSLGDECEHMKSETCGEGKWGGGQLRRGR
jgi:hypothetical protein